MRILKNHNNMNEEELQPKSNQWAPDDEGAKKGELNPKRISEQEFAYAIDQLKIPNCKSPGRLASVLLAGTGAGKSCVQKPIDFIMENIRKRDAENLKREKEWKDEMMRKGANKDKRKRPENLII